MDNHNLYEAVGGAAVCGELSAAFYARVARDPVLRPLFPGKSLRCAIEAFSAFLAQFLEGPPEDAQRRWWLSLRESHRRFKIGQPERDAWMRNMVQALDDVSLSESARHALRDLFERSSAYLVNVEPAPVAPDENGGPRDSLQREMCERWTVQRTLDQTVAAVRNGSVEQAIGLAESPVLTIHFQRNRSVFAALLATMIEGGNAAMLDYAREKLLADPALSNERYSGRTLLHAAAAAGRVALVEALLHLGAQPDETDDGGHTALYAAANECKIPDGAQAVRLLVEAGADPNACDGVKHCTALHMAARRGNVEIAEALLDRGATLEARDSLGDTPLRRAVNCDKTAVAALLLARGADKHSQGSKRLTPYLAARSIAMKRALQNA